MPPEAVAAGSSRPVPVAGASGSEGTAAAPASGTEGSAAVAPAVEKRKEPKPTVMWITAKHVLPVLRKGGKYLAPGARKAGLKPDMELRVVGPESNGKRKLLGSAKVIGALARTPVARLELDESARQAGGELFVAVPAPRAEPEPVATAPEPEPAPEPAPAPEAAPAPPPPPKKLAVGAKATGLLGMMSKGFIIHSLEDVPLSNCKATIERRQQYHFKSLVRGENKISQSAFRPSKDAPNMRRGWMLIECDEGQAELQIR